MEVNRHSYESGSRSRLDLAPLRDKTIESRGFPEQAGIFCRAASLILDGLSRRPSQWSAADEVNVEVEDGLSSSRSDVEDGAVALLDVALAGDLRRREMASADDFGVRCFGFFQSREVLFGDDENVCRCLRANIFERENVVVLVDLNCGDFTADDAAEKAGSCWIGHKKNPARKGK